MQLSFYDSLTTVKGRTFAQPYYINTYIKFSQVIFKGFLIFFMTLIFLQNHS